MGDVFLAAVKQGMGLDFRLRPLTDEDRRLGPDKLGARVWGPVLERLGLLTEEERMAKLQERAKKTTKADLIVELQLALAEIDQLRATLAEIKAAPEPSDEERTEWAVAWLADQFVASVQRVRLRNGCNSDDGKDIEMRRDLMNLLREIPSAYQLGFALCTADHAAGLLSGFSDPENPLLLPRQITRLLDQLSAWVIERSPPGEVMRKMLLAEDLKMGRAPKAS